MAPSPRSIDSYLRTVRPEQRAALEELRRRIHAAAPGAEETISYGLPAIRRGRAIVAFGAGKEHCALYPMSARVVSDCAADLKNFETSKGAIRFTPDRPLSATLVRKIVRARLAENEEKDTVGGARSAVMRRKERAPRAQSGGATSRRSNTDDTSHAGNAGKTSTSGSQRRKRGNDRLGAPTRGARVAARGTARAVAGTRTDPRVDAWLAALENPRRADIDYVRGVVLGADPSIREELKWNAPSFRTEEFFATVHARSRTDVQIVFHHGAKVRDGSRPRIALPAVVEPLVKWLAPDRLIVTLGSGPALRRRRAAIVALVRAWISV